MSTFRRWISLNPFIFWIVTAALFRIITSGTRSVFHHPDEWYQTVEFGNLIANGIISHTQEVSLHMRNMTWPWILSWPLTLARWISPDLVYLRVFVVQLSAGLANLAMIWGWWTLIDSARKKREVPLLWQHFAMAIPVLTWFSVADSLRPSQENLAQASVWLSLGLMVRGRYLLAGITAFGCFGFKYPAGLFTAGLTFALLPKLAWERKWRQALLYIGGLFAGLVIFGLGDFYYYGRPYESVWMYIQYNVWTGLSARYFGEQSATLYWDYFVGHWSGIVLPLTVALVIGWVRALPEVIKNFEPWFWALVFYIVGHFFTAHKEPRFMFTAEYLAAFGGVYGLFLLRENILKHLRLFMIAGFLVNAPFVLHALWGNTWRTPQTYFEITRHVRASPTPVCAVITTRKPMSLLFPWKTPTQAPEPGFGFYPTERQEPSYTQRETRPVIWLEFIPKCKQDETVLLHVHNPDQGWVSQGCELQPSGVLRYTPRSLWDKMIERDWVSGPWYRCPSTIISEFKRQELREVLSRGFDRLNVLPPYGITGDELQELRKKNKWDQDFRDGTMGDW